MLMKYIKRLTVNNRIEVEVEFKIHSKYKPTGDQPQAIEKLVQGLNDGLRQQVLLGVTGSGKTFTMANIIEKVQRPTIVIAHNKTLAAQLCNELREFFPENSVNYFVSYYDYYQPEAYIVSSDTYIEKDLAINDEIDKLRHSATCALFERRDVIIVASVSCIYGLGEPSEYHKMAISLRPNMIIDREEVITKLVNNQYKRNDIEFTRGTFRVRGDVLDVYPSWSSDLSIRIDFFDNQIEAIYEVEALTGKAINRLEHIAIYPASHYVSSPEKVEACLNQIEKDMEEEVKAFEEQGKLVEAMRLKQRTSYDIDMLREMGYTNGVENYSRYFDGREPGQAPYCLLDYFPDDYLMIIDESHITLPQIRAMYNGDRARKDNLVGYGFRLKSAYDNRPLTFDEFEKKFDQLICVSATPGPYEMKNAGNVIEQIIRPTGLLDPEVIVKPVNGQVDDLLGEINVTIANGGRILVTTLTKKMAEKLSEYLSEHGIRTEYLHSEIKTIERMEIINGLRKGEFDVLVGINLLREGLDLPEVKLVAILDADKEGFLRSEGALIQTIGRAARNAEGRVIMYGDVITDSMKRAIDETNRRREIQKAYNKKYGIIPQTIQKGIRDNVLITSKLTQDPKQVKVDNKQLIKTLEKELEMAVKDLDFEKAIELRDKLIELKDPEGAKNKGIKSYGKNNKNNRSKRK